LDLLHAHRHHHKQLRFFAMLKLLVHLFSIVEITFISFIRIKVANFHDQLVPRPFLGLFLHPPVFVCDTRCLGSWRLWDWFSVQVAGFARQAPQSGRRYFWVDSETNVRPSCQHEIVHENAITLKKLHTIRVSNRVQRPVDHQII
jgi:hypothetical protein